MKKRKKIQKKKKSQSIIELKCTGNQSETAQVHCNEIATMEATFVLLKRMSIESKVYATSNELATVVQCNKQQQISTNG